MNKFLIANPRDKVWERSYKSLPDSQKDLFYSPNFSKFTQVNIYKNYEVKCFIALDKTDFILCPFILRKFIFNNNSFFDITSLYPHGGPISNNPKNLQLKKYFQDKCVDYCNKNKIKNFLIRYHPLVGFKFNNLQNLKNINTGDFIYVDLQKIDENDILKNFNRSVIRGIKKAIKFNIETLISNDEKYILEFYDLYSKEMKRKKADKFYFFPKEFFLNLNKLKDHYQFFYSLHKKKIVSCELVLYNSHYSHSFLGSTNILYKNYCPNSLLKKDIIMYFKEKKNKYFFLGGGPEGVRNYKQGFKNTNNLKNFIGVLEVDKLFKTELKKNMSKKYKITNEFKIQFYDKYL